MGLLSRKIFSNSLWMILEKFTNILGAFLVTAYMANYIGPINFGKIGYVMSIFLLVQALVWVGNYEVILKKTTQNHHKGLRFLLSTQKIRRNILFLSSILILIYLYFFVDFFTAVFGLAFSISTYFLTQDVNIVYNNATLNSIYNTISNIIGLIASLFTRYLLVEFEVDYIFLALPVLLVSAIPFFLKKIFFNKKNNLLLKEKDIRRYSSYYIRLGSILVFSTFSIIFCSQINILILGGLERMEELGVYNAAVMLGSTWSFINIAIITAFFGSIYNENNESKLVKKIYLLKMVLLFVFVFVFVFVFFVGEFVVNYFFGVKYSSANNIVCYLVVATMLNAINLIYHKFMIKYGDYAYIAKKSLVLALISLPVSYCLIKKFGLHGAVYSLIFIEITSLTILNYFYKSGLIFKLQFSPLLNFKNLTKVFKRDSVL